MFRVLGKLFCAVTILCILGAAGAAANPDVWVKAATTFRFEESKITGIRFEWQFDEYFSSRTIKTFDTDQNGSLDLMEVINLRKEAFNPLEKFAYYTHIWVAKTKRGAPIIENFKASIDENRLVYRFTIPLVPPADPGSSSVIASLYDEVYHVDFKFKEKNFILVDGEMNPSCKFKIKRGRGAMSGHRQPVTLFCGE